MGTVEEIEAELEAMEAVYGSECVILQRLPPEIKIMLTPYTAEDTSVQFVQAVLVVKAGEQYPAVPPELGLKDVKGLDERRHADLLMKLRAQAEELSGGPSLVMLCEAAKDLLTSMNFPDGDCCFCRYPLMMEGVSGPRPFFKLKSCFHCFHSDCFGGWWTWLQHDQDMSKQPNEIVQTREGGGHVSSMDNSKCILCPVCRTVLLPDDVAHVVNTPANEMSPLKGMENEDLAPLVMSDEEMCRRAYFASQFEAQKARGGIIELKKLDVIQPGMILTPGVVPSTPPEEELESNQAGPSELVNRGKDRKSLRGRHQIKNQKPVTSGRRQWEQRQLRKQFAGVDVADRSADEASRSDAAISRSNPAS